MTPSEFKRSLSSKKPPGGLSPALTALWWAGNDSWDKAHDIVMSEGGCGLRLGSRLSASGRG